MTGQLDLTMAIHNKMEIMKDKEQEDNIKCH